MGQGITHAKAPTGDKNVPSSLRDKVSGMFIYDPVLCDDGEIYSRQYVESQMKDGSDEFFSKYTKMRTRIVTDPNAMQSSKLSKFQQKLTDYWEVKDNHKAGHILSIGDIGSILTPLHEVLGCLRHFPVLDRSFKLPEIRYHTPTIVAIGGQSCGISSILERICMLPLFPTTGTRQHEKAPQCRLEVAFMYSSTVRTPFLEVFTLENGAWVKPKGVIRQEFAIIEGSVKVSETMASLLEDDRSIADDMMVRITIAHPHAPNLKLVDLPGLSVSDDDMTRAALLRQLKTDEHTSIVNTPIYLVMQQASWKISNNPVWKIAASHLQFLHENGIGVLTMGDECYRTDRESVEDESQDVESGSRGFGGGNVRHYARIMAMEKFLAREETLNDGERALLGLSEEHGEIFKRGFVMIGNKVPTASPDDAPYLFHKNPFERLERQAHQEMQLFEHYCAGLVNTRVGSNALVLHIMLQYREKLQPYINLAIDQLRILKERLETSEIPQCTAVDSAQANQRDDSSATAAPAVQSRSSSVTIPRPAQPSGDFEKDAEERLCQLKNLLSLVDNALICLTI